MRGGEKFLQLFHFNQEPSRIIFGTNILLQFLEI